MGKIISFKTACRLSKKLRPQGKKVIFTSGFFDILHIGHIEFFQKVRRWIGPKSILMVGVDSDSHATYKKGNQRPIFKQEVRARTLSELISLDYIVLLSESRFRHIDFVSRVRKIAPDWVVYGNTPSLKNLRLEAKEAGVKFKHFPHSYKTLSSSHVVEMICKHLHS